MRREPRFVLLIAALALNGCEDRPAPEREASGPGKLVAEAAVGPVRATLHMSPAEPRFGERVRLVLDLVAGQNALLEPLEVPARLGHFRVRGHAQEGSAESGRLSYAIEAEPEKTGTNICRPPKVAFRVQSGEGAGTDQELALSPFEVEVAGLSPDQRPDLADLGTPLAPVPLPNEPGAGGVFRSALFVALVALAAGALWWHHRRRRGGERAPVVDPAAEAAHALDALQLMDLIGQGRFAEYYVRLTGIVRRYIERTTGIHAPEQTTEEFLRAMEGSSSFQPEQRQRLSTFLLASDMVKFAARVPGDREIEDAVHSARSFCGLAEQRPEVAA